MTENKNNDGKVITPEFRLAFPAIIEPKEDQSGRMLYSVVMLFPKSNKAELKALELLTQAAMAKKWPDASKRPQGLRSPFRDGDTYTNQKTGELYDGFPGHWFIRASSQYKPGLVDASLQPILNPSEIYGGCYCRAQVNAYAYDKAGNRGVSFGLLHVQKLRDGEAFSGIGSPEDVFSAIEQPAGNGDFLGSPQDTAAPGDFLG